MIDITTIDNEKLQRDLLDLKEDIIYCERALLAGIFYYEDNGSKLIQTRIDQNQHFIKVITEELNRRSLK